MLFFRQEVRIERKRKLKEDARRIRLLEKRKRLEKRRITKYRLEVNSRKLKSAAGGAVR